MGAVYAACDPLLHRRVALKLIRTDSSKDAADHEASRGRLLREAQTMARLSHPNVVQVFDGLVEDQLFVAMEFVTGTTLRRWSREAPRRPAEVIERFRQAGEGLAAAHGAGVVHRDFKPENVLVGEDGRTRVADFGLAHSLKRPPQAGPIPQGLNESFAPGGTPLYMAPEQLQAAWRAPPLISSHSACAYTRRSMVKDRFTATTLLRSAKQSPAAECVSWVAATSPRQCSAC
jgi:serine/threonine protein kinase